MQGDMLKDQRVTVQLTVDEFIALAHLAERLGLSQSAAIRMWIKEAIDRHSVREAAQAEVLKLHQNDSR